MVLGLLVLAGLGFLVALIAVWLERRRRRGQVPDQIL